MATGQLMFEVGIKSAQEQLDKIKQEFTKANGDLQKLLNLKVSIDGVDAVTKALNQIGDTTALRNLRNEIAALNREFSILSKGAGGSGDIAGRGLAADIERTSQSIDRYTSKIKQLTEERGRLVGGTRNSSYQNYTDEILRYEQSLEGARKKLAELNEQKKKPVAALKDATQQESEAMNHLKQQVVDLTEKVRILQTALSKSSGAPITAPINIDLSAIEPTIKTLNEAVNQLKKSMDLLWEATNRMEGSMKSLGGIEALEKIKTEATETKQQVDNLAQSVAGMSKQAEKKGSESTLADNLQRLKSAITDVRSEYNRLNETYGSAKDMGMPTNNAIEERLYNLRRLITMMEQLAQAALTAGSAEAEALSRSKAFSFVQFDNNQLFSKETNKLYSRKEIDGYIKMVEEFVKAEGRMAQTSGAATNVISEIGTALGRAAERASQAGTSFSQTTQGIQNFAMNIETARLAYDKTLRGIADLESRISAGQKANLDKESLDFMNGLKQRAQQWADVLKKILGEDMKGNPAYREFLSMSSSILTRPQMGNGLQALLGADWKILLKDIGSTFGMLMKFSGFNKELTLDNSTLANWLKGEEAVRRLDNALKDLNKQWAATNNEAKTPDLTAKYEAQKRAIESLIAQIKGAMTEEARMSNKNGLSDLLGVGFKNAVGYDNTRLIQEMRALSNEADKSAKEREKSAENVAKAEAKADEKMAKDYADLIAKREKLEKDYEQVWLKGLRAREERQKAAEEREAKAAERAAQQRIKAAEKAAEAEAKAQEKARLKDYATRQKEAINARKDAEQLVEARMKMLQSQAASLSKIMVGGKDKLDTYQYEQVRDALRAIREEMRQIQTATQRGGLSSQALFGLGGNGQDFSGLISAYMRFVSGKQQAAAANTHLTATEQQLANAIKGSTDNMRGQSQVLSDLKMMATQYLGVWGAQGFLRNVIEIGGQLEMQRLSIGAILGDMAKANELFDRIKNLAVKSPFGVVELDQMTKQLSAYGFEYNELFDMTKRLADISAATGTSVDRLALALGHVRSEAALSGYTLRQFSMANIPLAKKLSEELTKVEGKFVSVADVRKRVRTKDIGYEQVLKVLKDLTDEGGMFYNAQEIMSESVKARFKNLKDSMDIMYGEIAESSVGNALKDVASLLTTLTRHWQELGAVLVAGAGYWAVNRIAMMAMSKAAVTNNIVTGQFTAKQLEAQAVTGNLTKQQLLRAVASRKMAVADAEAAANVLGLTTAQLQLVRRTGDVSRAMTMATVATSKYSIAQLRFMAMFRSFSLFNLKDLFLGIASGAKAAGVAVLGLVKSFWPMLALSAVAEVFMSMKREAESFADAANYVGQSARNLMKDIDEAISSISKAGKPIDADALRESVKTMKEVLEQSEYYTAEQQNQVDNAKTLSEKYDVLLKQLKEMREEAEWQTNNEGLIEKILSNTGKGVQTSIGQRLNRETGQYEAYESQSFGLPFFNNSLQENIEQVNKSNASLQSAINLLSEYQGVMNEAIKKNNGFGLSLEGKSWQEQIRLIAQSGHWDEFVSSVENAGSRFEKTASKVKDASDKVRDDWQHIVDDDVKAIRLTLMEEWGMTEDDINQFAKNNERTMRWLVDSIAKSLSKLGVAEQIIDEFKRKLLELFGVASGGKPNKKEPTVYDLQTGLGKQIMSNVIRHNKNNGKGGNGVLTVKEVNELTGTGEHEKTESEVVKAIKERAQKDYQTMKDVGKIYGETSKKYLDAKKKYERSLNIAESNGINESEILTGKYKDKKDKKTTDEDARVLRERVRILKEAADSYQYWRDKVGESQAEAHMQDEFGQLLSEQKLQLKNADELKDKLQELRAEYSKKSQTKAMVEAIKEIDKELAQLERKDFERDTKKYVSQLTLEIEELTRKWEIFNSVRNETGDSALAQRLTGITPGATPADLKRYNVASFAGVDIDFDSVLQMSDEQIDRYVEKLGVPEEKIEAIRNGLKDWKKAQKDIITSDIQNYAKWLGSLVDLQSIQTRNQNEYNQTLEETNRLLKEGKITQEEADRRKKSAAVTLDTKNWQSTMMYSRLYDNALMMATSEFNDAYAQKMKSLNDQMKAGTLTAKDYADKVSNLNEIAKEFSIDGFLGLKGGVGAFLSGGNDALIQYYNKRAKDARMRQAFYQQAGDKKNAKNSEDEAKKYEGLTVSLVKVTEGAKKVFTAFQGLSNGIDMVADLFANMGDSGTAETLGDVGSVFGSALSGASSLSMFGPYGMAAGAAIGLVSGIFALQDKSIQREIDALKENVAALEENTQSIKDYRQRTLGYDEGKIRKSMADTYITTIVDAYKEAVAQGHHLIPIMDSSQFAMAKYYATNYGMSGYQAELENLKALREDYRKMYKLEHSKKNVSDEALREYTKQIAELDEQIFYFTEDLANELWGIDFKAWASQISDALWTAFENGESALEAFHDTARDIISDVAKRMMNIHLIEPVFNKLEERLFGKIDENGVRTGGVYNETTGQFDENETLRILGEFFGEDGEFAKVVESAEDFYKMAERVTGFDLSDDGGSSSSSKTIKGITEQTADLLASYVSAIRLDVSVIRTMDAKVLQEYWPSQIRLMTAGTQSLTNIEQHTLAIMRSNDVIAERITNLDNNINGLKSKTWSIPIA